MPRIYVATIASCSHRRTLVVQQKTSATLQKCARVPRATALKINMWKTALRAETTDSNAQVVNARRVTSNALTVDLVFL